MAETPTIRESHHRTTSHRAGIEQQRRWMTVAAGVAVILVLAFVFYLIRLVILPFGIAAALAFLAAPVVRRLQNQAGWPHWAAALAVYLAYMSLIALAGLGTLYYIVPEVVSVMQRLPSVLQHLFEVVFHGRQTHVFGYAISAQALTKSAVAQLNGLLQNPKDLALGGAISLSALVGFFLTLALLGYFLFQGPQLAQGLLWLVPPRHRRRTRVLAAEVEPVIYNYVRGVIVVVLYAMVTTGIVTGVVLRLPHAVLLAVAVGLLEMIPTVGPALALMLLGLVVAERATPELLIGFGAFAAGLRLSIDNVLAPLVLGKYVMLPPPVIIFSFLAGGVLFGFVGVLLAIPVAASIKVVLADLYGDRRTISRLRRGSAALRQQASNR
jgi:predicted PurR-regulated permease PerM